MFLFTIESRLDVNELSVKWNNPTFVNKPLTLIINSLSFP